MAIFDLKFLQEKYVSKYAKYLDDDDDKDQTDDEDDDENEDEEDEKEEKVEEKKSSAIYSQKNMKAATEKKQQQTDSSKEEKKEDDDMHLNRDEIRKCLDAIKVVLPQFENLKKCCDYIDLADKDKINDEGQRVSSYDNYYADKPNAFLQLLDGEVWGGYPKFRDGGNEDFEDDSNAFVKQVNELLVKHKIPAKFKVGPDKQSDESISYGVKSTKEK